MKSIVTLLVIINSVFLGCKANNSEKLCLEFYKANKGKNFDHLFEIATSDRFHSHYDERSKQNVLEFDHFFIYDSERDEYLLLPVFKQYSSRTSKEQAYKKCSRLTKKLFMKKFKESSDEKLLPYYIQYVETLLQQYYSIETPSSLSYKNLAIYGNPRLGRFIEFRLDAKAHCYYLLSRKGLDNYWNQFFNAEKILGTNWYYQIVR